MLLLQHGTPNGANKRRTAHPWCKQAAFPKCRLGEFQHVGSPVWMMRSAKDLPGNYTAFAAERPEWYTGSIADHNLGYVLAMRQLLLCCATPNGPGAL